MKVVWTRPSYRDLDEIQDFVAERSPRAAEALVNDIIDRSEQLLALNPRIGRVGRVAETRELVLPNTQYVVVYRLGSIIEIIAVLHQAREWPTTFS